MSKRFVTAVLALTLSSQAMAYCGIYDKSGCTPPAPPGTEMEQPSMKYDVYRNSNTTTYQPKETYRGRYGYELERYKDPITCTTIGNNTYCN